MISKKQWVTVVLAVGAAPALILCAVNGFVPGLDDLKDPLGRPSALSQELITSAGQLDELTSIFVPKHAQLSADIQALTPLADDLETLTTKAGELPGKSITVNDSTRDVSTIAGPLPDLIAAVTAHSDQAAPTVGGLSTAVGSVTTQLQGIEQNLGTVQGTLGELGPRGSAIASTLANIEEEARHVQAFGPLLAVIGPPVNSLNLPPLGVPAPTPTP
ncbi:hypothetical protein O4328_28440 [Rhodococcus opacus]|uniref:Uncharacterized protein n=1 Tax=Rhodococcus opacus TaxID=37919 RepID=A0AAX3YTN8_RHOOP|nr:hypothetical protein [Rhodococcus opacus]MCZ4587569.1 hypothetical protein [Rhodococcus opacus]WLF51429.1 hypothetical protein Q5707_37815 [Rhodococcus opacus]